jgi:hypothetical protein
MSAKNTGAANTTTTTRMQSRSGRSASTPDQWWKAWVLLTSLGTTMFGWIALPRSVAPPISGQVLPQATDVEDASALDIAVDVDLVRDSRTVPAIVRTEPAMPRRPVFRAPVTRTRRS